MERKIEKRVNIKFCALLGKTPTETLQMLQSVYVDEVLMFTLMYFCGTRDFAKDVHDDERSGAPVAKRTPQNVDEIRQLVVSDLKLTCKMIANK